MIEIGAVSSENTNLVTGANAPAPAAIGASIPNTREVEVNFDDVLDAINPLQHIPLLSSIYRAVTGESINPVSRIAGDALYGGIFGLASAGIGAAGALVDETLTAANDGQSPTATVYAYLFGKDTDQSAQIADATAKPDATPADTAFDMPAPLVNSEIKVAALQTPLSQAVTHQTPVDHLTANQSPVASFPTFSAAPPTPNIPPSGNTSNLATATPNLPNASDTKVAENSTTEGIALDRSKQAYGGVLDPVMMDKAQQTQQIALALASSRNTLQSEHQLHNNRFSTTTTVPNAPSLAAAINANTLGQTIPGQTQMPNFSASNPIQSLQSTLQNLQSMKGVNQYRATAQSAPALGNNVDLAN